MELELKTKIIHHGGGDIEICVSQFDDSPAMRVEINGIAVYLIKDELVNLTEIFDQYLLAKDCFNGK